ncbi:MAG TPA: 50S ribosomal protein L4 [Gemmatimonadaceae bacterium]
MADQTTLQAAAFTAKGTAREKVTLPEALFDGTVNMPVMHQAVKAYLANQRQGNAATKIRKYVTGGNQKPWRQKGTGRARQGSTRAPHWVGGGTVFGPVPRSYAQYVPRQVRTLARKSAFNARAREDAVIVIDRFDYAAPKTSQLAALIDRLDLGGRKVLILTDGVKPNVFLSGRNLPTVHVLPYADVSTYHLLWSDVVLVEASALGHTLAPVAETEAEPKAKRAKPAKAAPEAEAKASKKPAAKKAAKAPVGRKAAPRKPAAKKAAAKKPAAKKPSATKKKGK